MILVNSLKIICAYFIGFYPIFVQFEHILKIKGKWYSVIKIKCLVSFDSLKYIYSFAENYSISGFGRILSKKMFRFAGFWPISPH